MSHSSVMAQLYHTVQSWLNYTTQYSHGSTIPHSSVMAQLYHTVQSWLNYTTQYSHGSTIPHSTVMVYCYLYKCYLQLVVESPSQQVYNMGTLWCLNISVYSAHSVMQLSSCYVLLWCGCTGFAFVYNTTAG